MTRKRSGLGKGLDALIPVEERMFPTNGLIHVMVDDIKPNPRQPRNNINNGEISELSQSIQKHGILQPLIVSYDSQTASYTLIAGERRLNAAKIAGLKTVPVLIRETSEEGMLELALIENVQRQDLNPLETANAFEQLHSDFDLSHEDIAEVIGKSRTAVTNTLRLLRLPQKVKDALLDEKVSEGHARALLALENDDAIEASLDTIIKRGLNVRQTEDLVRKMKGTKIPAKRAEIPPEYGQIEDQLQQRLGTKVNLRPKKKGGTITIHYFSAEELDSLLGIFLSDD